MTQSICKQCGKEALGKTLCPLHMKMANNRNLRYLRNNTKQLKVLREVATLLERENETLRQKIKELQSVTKV